MPLKKKTKKQTHQFLAINRSTHTFSYKLLQNLKVDNQPENAFISA